MNAGKPDHTFTEQQRQQLLAVLSSEGVTQPADTSPRKEITAAIIKAAVVAGVTLSLLALIVSVLNPAGTAYTIFLLIFFFIVLPWLMIKFGSAAVKPIMGALAWRGLNASHAIMRAKTAPVLYLRSFQFDTTAQRGLTESPEMFLARLVAGRLGANGAPLLAIGTPDKLDPLPGALRFWVRQDLWQEKVTAIAPLCSLIIWTTGHTEGLDWEIQYLTKNIEPTKILLWLHARFAVKQSEKDAEWSKFVERYKDVFPRPLPAKLGEARFIAFDEQWTPITIPGKEFSVNFVERYLGRNGRDLNAAGLRQFLNARIR